MVSFMPPVNFDRLRDRRDELGLSNAKLAELVGKSQGYVENILYGNDDPSRQVMYRLRDALDLSMSEIEASDKTPQGDPSEPPAQPPPPPPPPSRRQEKAGKGPKRLTQRVAS